MARQHLSHKFSCFASAESPWTAEPHGVENEPLADCEYGWLVTDVMGMGREASLNRWHSGTLVILNLAFQLVTGKVRH